MTILLTAKSTPTEITVLSPSERRFLRAYAIALQSETNVGHIDHHYRTEWLLHSEACIAAAERLKQARMGELNESRR